MTLLTRGTLLAAAAAAAVLSGCASVPRATPEKDLAAKQFPAPSPGHAAVYVYRNEYYGSAARMSLLLNGQAVGDTTGHTFVWFWVGAGKHQIVSKAENEFVLDLDAKPGATYFVWQEAKMGMLSARSQLHLVDEATGKAGVAECQLVENAFAR